MKRIAALFLVVFATQAQAGLFSDDEARQQVEDLRKNVQTIDTSTQAQIKKHEDRLILQEAASKRTLELLNQIEKLRDEIAGLRGKIEVLQFNQDEASKRQRDLYVDLDARLRNMESKDLVRDQKAKEQAAQEKNAAQAAAEQAQIDQIVSRIKAGKNKDGIAALTKFVTENPQSAHAAEATYWIGVANTALKDYKAASAAFSEVADQADSPRAPDALLGLASIAAAQKNAKASRKYLSVIVEKYPQSEAAVTAKKALAVPN